MRVAFRVDASLRIGTGHLIRCLTLADTLSSQGGRCVFVQRAHPGHMADLIQQRGHEVRLLPAPDGTHDGPVEDYAAWLGVSPSTDARESREALADLTPDWLVVDHYALDAAWQARLRHHVGGIAVIDDLANRPHDADLLVDPNYSTGGEGRYDGLLPEAAQRLCGPPYALLDPVYTTYRSSFEGDRRTHPGRVERALVFFGGTDPADLTGRTLAAFSHPDLEGIALDVVVGANYPCGERLEIHAEKCPNITIYGPRPHLADLMAAADLAVGAGGSTTWERCCMGLPSLVVSIAENQRPASEALAGDGFVAYAGHADAVDETVLTEELLRLVHDPHRLRALSDAGSDLVDGLGSERVAGALLSMDVKTAATSGMSASWP